MTKEELFATYPEGAEDRRDRKHLWVPPGGGESLAHGVVPRAEKFIDLACTGVQAGHHIVAITHLYALHRRAPLPLRSIAGNTPARLILSRTRDHDIALDPLGLPGLVLDPRAGIHVTVLAATQARQGKVAVMATSANAAANVAAYGQHFTPLGPPQLSAGTRRSTLPIGTLAFRVPTTARAASAPATAGWQQPVSTNLPALRRPQKVEVTPWRA